MIILGINAFHGDSSAALVRDGALVAAAEEERFRRIKHWAGFPSQAIAYCLREAGLSPRRHRSCRRQSGQPRQSAAQGRLRAFATAGPRPRAGAAAATAERGQGVPELLARGVPEPVVRRRSSTGSSITSLICRRHSTSRRSSRQSSSRSTASAISPALPGAWARARTSTSMGRVYFPHSLGIFYQALTQYLRLSALRRRIQGHGACALRPADASGRHAADRAAQSRWDVRARSRLFPPSREQQSVSVGRTARRRFGDLFTPALEELLGPRRAAAMIRWRIGTAISPARCRRCMRKRSFICSTACTKRCGLDRSGARRRLRDEFGRQRQGAPDDAVPARLCAGGGRRCRRRDRRGLRGLAPARRRAFIRDGPRLLGSAIRRSRDRCRCCIRAATRDRGGRLHDRNDRRRGRALPANGGGHRGRQGRRLVSGTHGMGAARARQPLDRLRSAPRRYEGHTQRQDQAARSRSVRSRPRCSKRRWRNGSRRTTTSPS